MLRRLLKSKFLRAVAAVSSGQVLGAVLQIMAAPLLGRIYEPKEYGLLGGYMGMSLVLAAIGNWQYSQGIVIERCDNKAATLVYVCVWATSFTTLISAIVSVIVVSQYDSMGLGTTRWWYLTLPVSTFLAGFGNCLAALANRQGVYKRIAVIFVLPIAISTALSIWLGLRGLGVTGLFIAYFASQFTTVLMYWLIVPKLKLRQGVASMMRIRAMARKYRRFAIFTTPTSFISSFTMNAPIYALTALGATSTVGLFTRANQLLNMPINLIGNSIAQVFQRQAAVQFNETGSCWTIYKKTFVSLLAVGVIPMLFLIFSAPMLFAWFLGPKWTDAGGIARILAPMLLLRVVCSPLSTVFYVVEKQKEDLILSLVTSVFTLLLIFMATRISDSSVMVVYGYSFGFAVAYLAYIFCSAQYSLGRNTVVSCVSSIKNVTSSDVAISVVRPSDVAATGLQTRQTNHK